MVTVQDSASKGGSYVTSNVVSAVNITGNAVAGQTLTATPNPSNATVSYQWMSCDTSTGTFANITGAASPRYVLTSDDTGKYIKVTVSGTGGFTGTQTSEATAKVPADMTAYNAALAAVSEADYTSASWAAYMTVVNDQVTNQIPQAEVDVATSAITTAQANLVEKADMTAYNAALAAVSEADYTSAGWAAYMTVVNAHQVTNQNTQAEVDAATQAIIEAQADLIAIIDSSTATINVSVSSDGSISINSIIPYIAPDQYEPDNSYQLSTSILANGTFQTHTIPSGDIDWMKFDAVSGVTYKIQTSNLSSGMDTIMYLYDGDGTTLINWNDDTFINGFRVSYGSTINFTPTSTGTYYIRVTGYDLSVYGQYDISVTAAAVDMTAYNATLAAATEAGYTTESWTAYQKVVTANVVTNQNTQTEVDIATQAITDARVDLVALINSSTLNDIATLGLVGTSAVSSNNMVATVAVNSSTGRIDISSVGPGMAITITVIDGTKTARIYVDVWPDRSVRIWLIVPYTVGDQYEPDNSYLEAGSIAADGELQTHSISPQTDEDWFKFDATAGNTYEILTSNLSDSLNTYMYLYASNGTTVMDQDDDSGSDYSPSDTWGSAILFPPMTPGTYYVKIQSAGHMSAGQYDISITQS